MFSAKDSNGHILPGIYATGQDIVFSTVSYVTSNIVLGWEDLVRWLRPTIKSICFEGSAHYNHSHHKLPAGAITSLFTNTHTLEISHGCTCLGFKYIQPHFWEDLKKLGPELTTIRFKIPKYHLGLTPECDCDPQGKELLGAIEDLARYRFEHG